MAVKVLFVGCRSSSDQQVMLLLLFVRDVCVVRMEVRVRNVWVGTLVWTVTLTKGNFKVNFNLFSLLQLTDKIKLSFSKK